MICKILFVIPCTLAKKFTTVNNRHIKRNHQQRKLRRRAPRKRTSQRKKVPVEEVFSQEVQLGRRHYLGENADEARVDAGCRKDVTKWTVCKALKHILVSNTMEENIIALCASHITCRERFLYFMLMVQSWSRQTKSCQLHVSMSFEETEEDHVREGVQDLITKLGHRGLHITLRSKHMTQFEHYTTLYTELVDDLKDKWLIFTDDDDLWSPARVLLYLEALESQTEEILQEIMYVSLGEWLEMPRTHIEVKQPLNERDVQELLTQKVAVRQQTKSGTSGHYLLYCIRSSIMNSFINSCEEIMKHRFADLFFIKHIVNVSDKFIVIDNPKTWTYLFRQWSFTDQQFNDKYNTKDPVQRAKNVLTMYFVQNDHFSRRKLKDFCRLQGLPPKVIKDVLDKLQHEYDLKTYKDKLFTRLINDI